MKLKTTILAAVIATILVIPMSANAQSVAPYTGYDYNTVNLYTDGLLEYQFTGMTPGDNFLVFLEELNSDGSYKRSIDANIIIADGAGEALSVWTQLEGNWTHDDTFPMRVTDIFNNVLGYHFLAARPLRNHWGTWSGADDSDKVCIAGCVYNVEVLGIHHDPLLNVPDQNKVITRANDYTLLHYRSDSGAYPNPSDKIQIKDIVSGSTVFETLVDDLIDFNTSPGVFSAGLWGYNNFVVLATDGNDLPFVRRITDGVTDNISFTYDNPETANFPVGGYSYARVDDSMADAVIREGMSVWGITNDSNRLEWSVDAQNDPLAVTKQQRVSRRAQTQSLYDAFPQMQLIDSGVGVVDSVDHPFTTFRQNFYTSDSNDGTIVAAWDLRAVDLHYGQTTSLFEFTASDSYALIIPPASPSRADKLRDAISSGGFSTDVGSLVLWLIASLIMCYLMFQLNSRKLPMYTFGIAIVGGGLILLGVTTTFSTLVIGLASLMLLIVTFVMPSEATS